MFCPSCGMQIPDNSTFCSNCGVNFGSQPLPPQVIQQNNTNPNGTIASNQPQPQPKKKSGAKAAIIIIACIVAFFVLVGSVIGGVIIIGAISAANAEAEEEAENERKMDELQDEFLRDWQRVESNEGTYYTLVLDFSYSTITYDFESTYVNETIKVYSYEIISPNQIKVNGKTHTIKFNDAKTMMTVTPAITSTDSVEYWYNFD